MIDIIKRIVNKKIKEIYNNFLEQTLMLSFEDGCILKLYGCAIVFDLGIIGQTVSYASCDGTPLPHESFRVALCNSKSGFL